ncbi:signal peptidase I [Gottfriedia sp. NPDC057991]|uniref:signal peptidase I n=1 Tax=Gottfriedia sp. NPDC057991 TaxID=3346298 RepID=UPI0036DCBE2E
MKKLLKLITSLLVLILTVTAVTVIYYVIQSKGNIEKMPTFFGYRPLTVLSNSMKPEFSAGDIIFINEKRDPKIHDVVTFKRPDELLVTHRITKIIKKNGTEFFITKGDLNNTEDEVPIVKGSILGVEAFHIPRVGYIAKFLVGPTGFFLLIVLPLLAVVILEIFQRLGLIENKKKLDMQS